MQAHDADAEAGARQLRWVSPQPFTVISSLTVEEGQKRLAAALLLDQAVSLRTSSAAFSGQMLRDRVWIRKNLGLFAGRRILYEYAGQFESQKHLETGGMLVSGAFHLDLASQIAFVMYLIVCLGLLLFNLSSSLVTVLSGLLIGVFPVSWLLLLTSRPQVSQIETFLLQTLEGTELSETS